MSPSLEYGYENRADMRVLVFSISSLLPVDTWMTSWKGPTSLLLEPSKCVDCHSTSRFKGLREPI